MAATPAAVLQREFDLRPADNLRLANLCGPLDENLRLLEDRLDVQIRRRGNHFRVSGERGAMAESILRELFELSRERNVTPEQVHLSLSERQSEAAAAARPGAQPAEGDPSAPGARADELAIRVRDGAIRARG